MKRPMQFNKIGQFWRRLPSQWMPLAGLVILTLAGCASASSSVKFEPRSVTNRLGFAGCKISVALSPSEVIENSKRSGNPSPERNSEWIEMESGFKSGDQLRLVNCLGVKGVGDPYYYALFRNRVIVLKFHPMIFD